MAYRKDLKRVLESERPEFQSQLPYLQTDFQQVLTALIICKMGIVVANSEFL